MNIIDERDVRTIHRKLKKKQYDELMTLSTAENWVRLLDEGMVTYGDGSPWFYLAKGTLRKYYESLSDDYVGSINIGHTDLATFPERIVGSWTKKDLRLTALEDGRYALDVRLNLIENHPLVRALKMLPFDLGVSAEFYTTVDEELTNNKDLNPYGVDIVTGVNITDFGIVGDAGNVNSMGVTLKGEKVMKDIDFKALSDALENEGKDSPMDKLNDALSEVLGDEEVAEEVSEEATEEATEEVTEEVAEEVVEEATEEVAEEATEETTEEAVEETGDLNQLSDKIIERMSELEQENATLKAEVASLQEKLSAKEKSEAAFFDRFKEMAVKMSTPSKPEVKETVQYTDGIGE